MGIEALLLSQVITITGSTGQVVTRQADGSLALENAGGGGSAPAGFRAAAGHFYNSQNVRNAGSLVTQFANTLYLYPFRFESSETWTTIYLHCQSIGSANARLGIYYPDSITGGVSRTDATLAVDAGIVTNGATGAREVTGISLNLDANRICLLAVLTNANFQSLGVPSANGLYQPIIGGNAATVNSDHVVGLQKTGITYGPLPATVSGITAFPGNLPLIGMRL